MIITSDLKVALIDLGTLKMKQVADLADIQAQSQQSKVRKYDYVLSFASYSSQTQLLTVNLLGKGLMIFKLSN
jgi:hypothetical protein